MAAEFFASPTKQSGQTVTTYVVGQPLIFSIQDDGGSPPDRFWVTVETNNLIGGGTLVEIAKLYLTPNPSGKAYFDLSPIAEAYIEQGTTQAGEIITPAYPGDPIHAVPRLDCAEQPTAVRFVIRVGSYNSGTESSVEDTETFYSLSGTEQPTSGLFPSYLEYTGGGDYGFLTDVPFDEVSPGLWRQRIRLNKNEEQTRTLFFGQNMGYGTTGQVLQWSCIDEDGNLAVLQENLTSAIGINTRENVLFLGLGYYTLRPDLAVALIGAPSFNPFAIERVEISLYDTLGTTQVGGYLELTWDDDTGCQNGFVQLAYSNTRGGYDYLRFDSRIPKRVSVEGKQYRRSILDYGGSTFSMNGQEAQYATFAKTGRVGYTLQSLFFDENQRQQLDIAIRSKTVAIRVVDSNGSSAQGWQPATIVSKSVTIEPSGSRFYNVSLDVEVAQDVRC